MAERPAWFKGTVEGGRKGDSSRRKEYPALKAVETSYESDTGKENPPQEAERTDGQGDRRISPELIDEPHDGAGSIEVPSEFAIESELVGLYLKLSRNKPADFHLRARPDRVSEHAKALLAWTPGALLNYLSTEDVWQRPAFTKAVFDEINQRMLRGKMGPR